MTDPARPWLDHAACRGVPTAVFFPGIGKPTAPAKKICADCPVLDPCLDYALETPWLTGIWGGTSEKQRREIRTGKRPPE